MKHLEYDVAVIGAGAAGLAAAEVTAKAGRSTIVIDREEFPGGVLLQCIHNGFGLHHFKEELTGPEYAGRLAEGARAAGAELMLNSTVIDLSKQEDGTKLLTVLSSTDGVTEITAKAVLLAMGCRERNRGNIGIPGTRPAGVYTAGLAQRLLNMSGLLPGKSAVIVGSGDIGLIMARRLSWSGIPVKAVIEIRPFPSGLARNIAQCLDDFDIPLYLGHTVTRIIGHDRVEGVEVSPLVDMVPDESRKFTIDCDTVLLSVGLIPENELSKKCGVPLNGATGGALVDAWRMTGVDGVFAAGNVLHVHDLADYASSEAALSAARIIEYLDGARPGEQGEVAAGSNLRYVSPNRFVPGAETQFFMRALVVDRGVSLVAELDGREIMRKKLRMVAPPEMISVTLEAGLTAGGRKLVFNLEGSDRK
ncbi:MAG: NAD(P)/FAD-dependent oxidoreductase [Victivallaceae bacterium]|nr:FAD-dependent oxidoreductase [Victivallaceae bacterium]